MSVCPAVPTVDQVLSAAHALRTLTAGSARPSKRRLSAFSQPHCPTARPAARHRRSLSLAMLRPPMAARFWPSRRVVRHMHVAHTQSPGSRTSGAAACRRRSVLRPSRLHHVLRLPRLRAAAPRSETGMHSEYLHFLPAMTATSSAAASAAPMASTSRASPMLTSTSSRRSSSGIADASMHRLLARIAACTRAVDRERVRRMTGPGVAASTRGARSILTIRCRTRRTAAPSRSPVKERRAALLPLSSWCLAQQCHRHAIDLAPSAR